MKFGAQPRPSFTVNSATSITATAPAGPAGAVDVTVTTPGGTSATSAADHYTYVAAPTVTSVSPTAGPTAAAPASRSPAPTSPARPPSSSAARTRPASPWSAPTQITATAPAGSAGTVDVTVTTAGGTSATSANDRLHLRRGADRHRPRSQCRPARGRDDVTITGTNLTGATAVKFGATDATGVTVVSATQITATAPAAPPSPAPSTSRSRPRAAPARRPQPTNTRYTNGPSVAAISPTSGPTAGGTSVTITGTNLASATAVKFGSNTATINSNTATQIVADRAGRARPEQWT